MGLINTLTAIECGIDYADATILGMGRGAGNLNMELLLTCLAKGGLEVDFNVLGEVVETFKTLYEEHRWGYKSTLYDFWSLFYSAERSNGLGRQSHL